VELIVELDEIPEQADRVHIELSTFFNAEFHDSPAADSVDSGEPSDV